MTESPPTAELQACLSNVGYDVGPIDGIDGPQTTKAFNAFVSAGQLSDEQIRACYDGIQSWKRQAQGHAAPSFTSPAPAYRPHPRNAPPATPGYGEISTITGLPRTQYVQGYTRKDGTFVKPHYRSPRRH
jgi:peptidoglycan hydrolase-like protein with peptidoglycan-binding domain